MRESRCRALALGAALAIAAWAGLSGCGGVLNPNLVGTIGGNPAASLQGVQGYIVILLMNNSPQTVQATIDFETRRGETFQSTLSVTPINFFAVTRDCDLGSIDVLNFAFAGVAGTTEVPADLGTLQVDRDIHCGDVLSITAAGTPPTFTVGIF